MSDLPEDPEALVPQQLSDEDSQEYEQRTVAILRKALIGNTGGLLTIDAIELIGARPETLVVFRYRYRPQHVGPQPEVRPGACAEAARLWEFAIDPGDRYARGMMDGPGILAAAIGSAFEAAELPLVDPETRQAIGHPPHVFPRLSGTSGRT